MALSMNQGGWIHPCVMDCFGHLTTVDQNLCRKEGKFSKNDILKHIVIKETTVSTFFSFCWIDVSFVKQAVIKRHLLILSSFFFFQWKSIFSEIIDGSYTELF
jgi:hypothetical protein